MKYTDAQIKKAMKGTAGIVGQILGNLKELSKVDNLEYTRQALYKRIDENPELKQAYVEEQERIGDLAESAFSLALAAKEPWAVKEWFKYKGWGRNYIPKQQTDITSGDQPIPLLGVIKLDSNNSITEDSEPKTED